MTTSAAATNYRDVVGRARDLEAIVESHRSEWAGALQEQRQLSERLSTFADGEWAAWARSETAAEPLPPLLRAGMRVHWLVRACGLCGSRSGLRRTCAPAGGSTRVGVVGGGDTGGPLARSRGQGRTSLPRGARRRGPPRRRRRGCLGVAPPRRSSGGRRAGPAGRRLPRRRERPPIARCDPRAPHRQLRRPAPRAAPYAEQARRMLDCARHPLPATARLRHSPPAAATSAPIAARLSPAAGPPRCSPPFTLSAEAAVPPPRPPTPARPPARPPALPPRHWSGSSSTRALRRRASAPRRARRRRARPRRARRS